MSYFYEIAYAAESDRLCLFTGTGFSKAITDNSAPSWQGLLEELCALTTNGADLKSSLFPEGKPMPLTLDEAAQVIAIEMQKSGKSIHAETAKLIEQVKLAPTGNESIIEFFSDRSFRVITTNYDKLVEELCLGSLVHSFAPGLPIPRSKSQVKVYHIHGSTDSPEDMIITSEDYFKFFHAESYFSRKLSTVLHENTVVILGYSLGDTNLKSIINDYKKFTNDHAIGSSVIFVSRSPVSQYLKDYYSYCFGIRVIDNMETNEFFKQLNVELSKVEGKHEASLENLKKVLYKGHSFTPSYIRIESAFFEIIASINASGLSLVNEKVIALIATVINEKRKLTGEQGAWEQYEQLAKWLVHLGSILDIGSTPLKDVYLETVLRSMQTMRQELYLGYSWHAFKVWENGWTSITSHNRAMIRTYILDHSVWPDAHKIVKAA
ncbi:SIR2 family protein [Vibrio splendidus]|uniref:SIR2 family NAD-dependent protein deacylase n=1 Tax=Vibrio splendidus TaxID=29497 RepID=UPI001E4F181E|nr:SIR2 family protein [Vibrio splendidus]